MASTAFTSALWFIAVLALIPFALWLLKRTPLGGGAGAGSTGVLRHVAALPLSPQGIHTLHTMAPQAEPAGGTATAAPNFAALLGRLRKDGGTP